MSFQRFNEPNCVWWASCCSFASMLWLVLGCFDGGSAALMQSHCRATQVQATNCNTKELPAAHTPPLYYWTCFLSTLKKTTWESAQTCTVLGAPDLFPATFCHSWGHTHRSTIANCTFQLTLKCTKNKMLNILQKTCYTKMNISHLFRNAVYQDKNDSRDITNQLVFAREF